MGKWMLFPQLSSCRPLISGPALVKLEATQTLNPNWIRSGHNTTYYPITCSVATGKQAVIFTFLLLADARKWSLMVHFKTCTSEERTLGGSIHCELVVHSKSVHCVQYKRMDGCFEEDFYYETWAEVFPQLSPFGAWKFPLLSFIPSAAISLEYCK